MLNRLYQQSNFLQHFQCGFVISSFKDFAELWPDKFQNKTNGITPRRWLLLCNPNLSDLIMEKMQGTDSWITNLSEISQLKTMVNDASFLRNLMRIKRDNKAKFAAYMEQNYNVHLNTASLFDIQVSGDTNGDEHMATRFRSVCVYGIFVSNSCNVSTHISYTVPHIIGTREQDALN